MSRTHSYIVQCDLETPIPGLTEEHNTDSARISMDQEQTTRVMELETEIEKACQEEDYDRAGDFLGKIECVLCYCVFYTAELEEELQAIKNS